MTKEELLKRLKEEIPEDADITWATATFFKDKKCYDWDSEYDCGAYLSDGYPPLTVV